MHMADALLSPAVGGTMWVVTAATTAYASRKVKKTLDDSKVPLMGVLAAFVFAIQMINFSIPGTGSSGHLLGGLLLAILLGPHAACLAIASVIMVQALFFADGGLLALGCNIFNMGIIGCYIGYPLVYKKIAGDHPTGNRLLAASLIAGVISLQLGAFAVVLETTTSGISELPFASFIVMMQPIHLAIGIVEGLITAGIISFIWQARPDILECAATDRPLGNLPIRKILTGMAAVAMLTAGIFSWFASSHPDGLEWSLAKVTGHAELVTQADGIHSTMERLQEKTAFLPDYGFRQDDTVNAAESTGESGGPVSIGTSVAGLVGGVMVMLLGLAIGFGLKKKIGHPA